MSACQSNPPASACPPTAEDLRRHARERLDAILAYCSDDQAATSFLDFETALLRLLRSLGCLLIQLFLQARHDRIDPTNWRARGYRVADPAVATAWRTPPPGGFSRPVAGRSPMPGRSSCRGTAAGPACTPWTWRRA
jgi:hypothetical protein